MAGQHTFFPNIYLLLLRVARNSTQSHFCYIQAKHSFTPVPDMVLSADGVNLIHFSSNSTRVLANLQHLSFHLTVVAATF